METNECSRAENNEQQPNLLRVAQIVVLDGLEVSVQLVDKRDPSGDVQACNGGSELVRD
jgi:hypothetical protein